MRASLRWVFAAILPAFIAGCGGSDANHPPTYEVTGVVTYKGLPVPDAQVTFAPSGQGQPAFGRTDAEGRYELTTFQPGDGATAGRYVVTVTKYEQAEQTAAPTGDAYVPPEGRGRQKTAKPKSLLPLKYASPKTSDLHAEVEKATTFDIQLAG